MFSRRPIASLAARTVANRLKMAREPEQVAGQVVNVTQDRNIAALLEETDETASAVAVVPGFERVRAETGTSALVL